MVLPAPMIRVVAADMVGVGVGLDDEAVAGGPGVAHSCSSVERVERAPAERRHRACGDIPLELLDRFQDAAAERTRARIGDQHAVGADRYGHVGAGARDHVNRATHVQYFDLGAAGAGRCSRSRPGDPNAAERGDRGDAKVARISGSPQQDPPPPSSAHLCSPRIHLSAPPRLASNGTCSASRSRRGRCSGPAASAARHRAAVDFGDHGARIRRHLLVQRQPVSLFRISGSVR